MGLFAMSGMEVNTDEADACTQEIMEAIDVDKDGDVTKVRAGVTSHLFYLNTFITLGGVH